MPPQPPIAPTLTAAGKAANQPPGVAPAAGTADPAPSPWPAFARRGLINQGVCAVVALVAWLMVPTARGNLFTAWVYSAAIGNFSWLFIDGGRLLLAAHLPNAGGAPLSRRGRWPGPGWMAVCIVLGTGLGYTLGSWVGDAITGFSTPQWLSNRPALAISVTAAIAATWYYWANERLRQEQATAETARREATETQLMLLQSQLEPHMLFNTLANLRVLITLDPPRAQAMLDRLIAYLRATLGASRQQGQHPLADEFARLDDYLQLMALRMGPRLQVRLLLPEALRGLPVPPLLLQPLVENSIRHGLEPKVAGGRIEVLAAQRDGRLWLTVRDTGVGLPPEALSSALPPPAASAAETAARHFGTRHVAERLATLYGDAAHFSLRGADDEEGGAIAELMLPLPPSPPPSP